MSNQEESIQLLIKEVKELNEKITKMEAEIEDIKFFSPRPVLTPAMIGQIGGYVLGALAIIGLFW